MTAAVSAKSLNSWPSAMTPCSRRISACPSPTSFCRLTKFRPETDRAEPFARSASSDCDRCDGRCCRPSIFRRASGRFPAAGRAIRRGAPDRGGRRERWPVWSRARFRTPTASSASDTTNRNRAAPRRRRAPVRRLERSKPTSLRRRLDAENHASAELRDKRRIAHELNGIAEALLVNAATRSCRASSFSPCHIGWG